MTDPVVSSYPGYATPTFVVHDNRWIATAYPLVKHAGYEVLR